MVAFLFFSTFLSIDLFWFPFQIINFMVMSIISAVFSTAPLSMSAAVIPIELDGYGLFENPQEEVPNYIHTNIKE